MKIFHGSDSAVPEPKILPANRLLDFGFDDIPKMDKAKFEALLPLIVAALIQKIIERKKISADEAFSRLYNSRLYFALDDEQTKVWHYSAEKLFELFEAEMETGNLELPEY